ncbi:hypothetical protein BV25DRAFT_1920950 [Artomyces pyxidatus]|uniref:Uncharacterized protein n=1 Tax=Artomyces pyxidatus TaxID=48021 RepID=A0ACB8SLC9_9AGAM|nr:hypothetical protein BV25DRAFT_1920950 [Artomyces pyxidatus]
MLFCPLLALLADHKLDFHLTLWHLCAFQPALLALTTEPALEDFLNTLFSYTSTPEWLQHVTATQAWLAWLRKYGKGRSLRTANPRFVLRQWLLDEVIAKVEADAVSGRRAQDHPVRDFEATVRRDFAGAGPYAPISLPQPASSPFSHPSMASSVSIPSFTHRTSTTHIPIIPNPTITYPSSCDAPEALYSVSTSSASSVSPPTPPEMAYTNVKDVTSVKSSRTALSGEGLIAGNGNSIPYPKPAKPFTPPAAAAAPAATRPAKSKVGRDQFALG